MPAADALAPDSPPPDARARTGPGTVPLELVGYRVVRVLGRDERALTALVHADGAPFVARVLAASTPEAVIDAELAVHDAIATGDPALRAHAVALRDLATLPDGRFVLLLEQLPGPRLADVLGARRGGLALAEAVTVLAPLATAVDSAHAVGLTGLGLDPAGVRLRASGAPVIMRVQDARSGPVLPERFRAADAAHLADRAALERLGAAVAAAVVEPDRPALLAALRAPERGTPLAHALFDLAEPQPLRASAPDQGPAIGSPLDPPADAAPSPATSVARAAPPAVAAALPTPEAASVGEAARPQPVGLLLGTLRELGLPSTVIDPVARAADRALALGSAMRARAAGALDRAPVRPRFAIAGAAGAAAVVLAIVLGSLGGGPGSGAALPEGDAESTVSPAEPGSAPTSDAGTDQLVGPDDATAGAAAPVDPAAPELAPDPAAEEWQGIVEVLLNRWSACRVAAASARGACGAEVVHAGSAAELLIAVDDERHTLLQRWRDRRGEVVVVERMGGAVLVDLVEGTTTTASLLIVRSEAGWRLRDVRG